MPEGPGPYELDGADREPTPLEKNRAVVQWLEYQLRQAKKRVQQLETEEARERGRREQAHAGLRWKLQPEQPDAPALLHRGDCAAYPGGGGYISRDDALIAMEMPEVEPCRVCRPEKGLTQR